MNLSKFQHINEIGLFYCMIPKNGATITKIMLCDLYRYFRQIPFKAAFGPKKKLSECKLKKWKLDYKNNQNKWEICENPVKFVLIREPLKRFLSLYGYLCEYLKMCGSEIDIHKFTKDVYVLLSTRSVKETNFVEKHGDIVTYHAQPQSWFCNLSEELKKFHLIHHNSNRLEMRSEFRKVFDEAKVPKLYSDQVLFHLFYSNTQHANHDKAQPEILKKSMEENPGTMAYFNAIYHKDFEVFDFKKQ